MPQQSRMCSGLMFPTVPRKMCSDGQILPIVSSRKRRPIYLASRGDFQDAPALEQPIGSFFGKQKFMERHKLLSCKVIWDILPTSEVIGQRLNITANMCLLLHNQAETLGRLLLHRPFSRIVWANLHIPLRLVRCSMLCYSC